jgi:hypothetical protein
MKRSVLILIVRGGQAGAFGAGGGGKIQPKI